MADSSKRKPTRKPGQRLAGKTSPSSAAPNLQDVWEHLAGREQLGQAVEQLRRGMEWDLPLGVRDSNTGKTNPILANDEQFISRKPKRGFQKGPRDTKRLFCFQSPPPVYLNTRPELQMGNGYALDWHRPKVIFNSKRKSRGPWRLAAFADTCGLVVYQTFTCAWPSPPWKPQTLAAVLNGPIANAFITAHEGNRDITKETLLRIPMPEIALLDQSRLEALISRYIEAVENSRGLAKSGNADAQGRRLLREIDAMILRAYRIPPRLERQVLDYFRGAKRPVPFEFGDYYPEDFKPYIPLWMYDSKEFAEASAQRFAQELPKVTDPDLQEVLADL